MKLRRFTKSSVKKINKVLNIWIDGYEANMPQRLGSSQVAFELIKNLEQIDKKNNYTILLPNQPLDDLPRQRNNWNYKILRPNRLWTRIALPLALYSAQQKPDVIFSPTHYIPRFSPVKRVVTIFDLSFLHFPQMFKKEDLYKLTNWTKFSILNSEHIITISNFSKKDIIKQYNINKNKQASSSGSKQDFSSNKITVAYPGYDKDNFKQIKDNEKTKQIISKYKIDSEYLIFVGTIQPRKNLVKLMEAFAQVVKDLPNLKLVLVGKTKGLGKQAWMFDEILDAPKKLEIEDKVIFTGFIPNEDLPYLLNGAISYILPSLWEGFGIPVLEAMGSGTPVIVSNVSSLPEVVGSAGLLVDPNSAEQISQAIRTVVADKKLRQNLSKKGLNQAHKYSWKKMAKTVLKTLEEVANR